MDIRFSAMRKLGKGFVHKLAFVEGNVVFGKNTSVWPFAVLRADEGKIIIGKHKHTG